LQEFYVPLKANSFLTEDQLQTVFLNLDELITINEEFIDRLLTATGLNRPPADNEVTAWFFFFFAKIDSGIKCY
jgi:hypothetical protein